MVSGQGAGDCRDGPAVSGGAVPHQDTHGGWLGAGGGCWVQLCGRVEEGGGLCGAAVQGAEPALCGQVSETVGTIIHLVYVSCVPLLVCLVAYVGCDHSMCTV